MGRFEQDLLETASSLGLARTVFDSVPRPSSSSILERIEARFVSEKGLRWWWTAFRPELPQNERSTTPVPLYFERMPATGDCGKPRVMPQSHPP